MNQATLSALRVLRDFVFKSFSLRVTNQTREEFVDGRAYSLGDGPDVEGGDGAGEDVHGVVGAEEDYGGYLEERDEQAEGDAN